jgi:hypothetical protein
MSPRCMPSHPALSFQLALALHQCQVRNLRPTAITRHYSLASSSTGHDFDLAPGVWHDHPARSSTIQRRASGRRRLGSQGVPLLVHCWFCASHERTSIIQTIPISGFPGRRFGRCRTGRNRTLNRTWDRTWRAGSLAVSACSLSACHRPA